ncbi:hypothetical protein [Martelella limonii]|uniref:hypothetical protein n=1 Tax=Martelella limonii TaxID=1647649 RepID=UPI00157FE1D0|nr:hypothetical protein [Martelella limonii]
MSEVKQTTAGSSTPLAVMAVIVIGALSLMFFLGKADIERSAIGTAGLAIWLEGQDVSVDHDAPVEIAGEKTPILRILPLYDPYLTIGRGDDDEREASAQRLTFRKMPLEVFTSKIESADTLVVLPKWRSDMVSTGKADRGALIADAQMTVFGIWRGPSVRTLDGLLAETAVLDQDGASLGQAALYAPRVLSEGMNEICEPLLTLGDEGTLLARCDDVYEDGVSFYLLSDPDLLDNHGLANGDNASIATEMIRDLAAGRPVYIDPTTYANVTDTSGVDPHERSLADLGRFFGYPFSLFWLGAGLTVLLALWRGSRRFGEPLESEGMAVIGSKSQTISASSRLLRLSGSQSDLVAAYVRARMELLNAVVLGPSRRASGTVAQDIMTRVSRRAPETGARLATAYAAVTDPELDPHRRLSALTPFEKAVQETLDEFGHASRPS